MINGDLKRCRKWILLCAALELMAHDPCCLNLQSAILGMHSIQKRPVVVGENIVARPMMYVALTYDHRLIDGREAVLFLRAIKDAVEDPRRLLLDL